MQTLKTETLTWHHFQNPAKADFDFLREKFNFHDLILGELMKPTLRPKVDRYNHYLYLVLHFPIFDEKT
ncbi:MAG: CorA family divalent cation transporter, partial [Candidatus Liptonbacteria bacterium]|nr:CorA family divalent cation transporter [Candidatus Liptonbacteria bacterium]